MQFHRLTVPKLEREYLGNKQPLLLVKPSKGFSFVEGEVIFKMDVDPHSKYYLII
jgi:hypothetical protein